MAELDYACSYQVERAFAKQPEPKFDRPKSPEEIRRQAKTTSYLKGEMTQAELEPDVKKQLTEYLGQEWMAKIDLMRGQGAPLGKYVPASEYEKGPMAVMCHPKWQWRPIANDPARIDAQGDFVRHPEVFVDYDKTAQVGQKGSGLGIGMEILREGAGRETIKYKDVRGQAFPKTPEGVVQAALYFVHQGEKRTFQDILNDQTKEKFAVAKTAPKEDEGNNDDLPIEGSTGAKKHGQYAIAVGHIGSGKHKVPIGAIRAIQEIGNDSYSKDKKKQLPWCGSFAATVYALCGINMEEGIVSAAKAPKKLASMPGAVAYERKNLNTTRKVKIPQGNDKEGKKIEKEVLAYEPSNTLSKVKPQTLKKGQKFDAVQVDLEAMNVNGVGMINIGPGFMAWLHHNADEGHVMIVLATKHVQDGVEVITAEGNSNDALEVKPHKITYDPKTGAIGGEIAGWGAPKEIAELAWRERPDPAVEDFLNNPMGAGGSDR